MGSYLHKYNDSNNNIFRFFSLLCLELILLKIAWNGRMLVGKMCNTYAEKLMGGQADGQALAWVEISLSKGRATIEAT
jgi:hypothetical protein